MKAFKFYILLLLTFIWSCAESTDATDLPNSVTLNYTFNGTLPAQTVTGSIVSSSETINFSFSTSTDTTGTVSFPDIVAGAYTLTAQALSDSADVTSVRYEGQDTFTVIEDVNNVFNFTLEPVDGAVDITIDLDPEKNKASGVKE